MDSGDSLIDPQAEVRKLQDLVKKLEYQNEMLRNKKLPSDNLPMQDGQPVKQYSKSISTLNSRINDKENKSSVVDLLDDVDLIDIDKSLTDSEDSWLYSSPRPLTPKQSCVSPYKWVRQDLDHPSPDIDVARRSLKSKLEEAARLSRSTSTPAFSNVSITPARSSPTMSQSADNTPSSSSRLQRPAIRQSLVSNMGTRVDSGTFTRPKKNKECDTSIENNQVEVLKENVAQTYPNVADIETLAKLQEESLRQSLAQTSPRRGFRSRPLPHVAPVSSDTDNSGSPVGSNRSSPARIEAEGINHKMNNSNNSLGSDNSSSPPDSPFGSNQHLHPQSGVWGTPYPPAEVVRADIWGPEG
ncbi:hypothetical protein CHS0354_037623 [Potamilus streckersoni]|uniref:SLAIN motif-containing protein 2 n=1 Tax=Potamilus streckersoni TaxID=2493646 RepID=A0AAE0VJL1_9BIVA|nr:hypothetical protein CHS0354_037623 [Potamilus streckersoni]